MIKLIKRLVLVIIFIITIVLACASIFLFMILGWKKTINKMFAFIESIVDRIEELC